MMMFYVSKIFTFGGLNAYILIIALISSYML